MRSDKSQLAQIYAFWPGREEDAWIEFEDPGARQALGTNPGKPLAAGWNAYRIRFVSDRSKIAKVPRSRPDFPDVAPILSRKAIEALEPLLRGHCEILPLSCDAGEYYFANVVSVIDLLDLEASGAYNGSDGRVLDVKRYVFKEGIDVPPIFKLAHLTSRVFVTRKFVRAVRQAGLIGFAPRLIWDRGEPVVQRYSFLEPTRRKLGIKKILALPPQECLDALTERLIDRADGPNPGRMSEAESTLYLVHAAEELIAGDGFEAFFQGHGHQAPEAIAAFRRLGAEKSARILEAAFQPFRKSGLSQYEEKRYEEVEAALGSEAEKWDALAGELAGYPDPLADLKYDFVLTHSAEFT